MPEITPGPWRIQYVVGPVPDDQKHDQAIVAGENQIIAEVFHRVGKYDWAPVRANAALIAAAPELLAACEGALHHVTADPPTDDAPDAAWRTHTMMVDILSAAIAKAKGEAR